MSKLHILQRRRVALLMSLSTALLLAGTVLLVQQIVANHRSDQAAARALAQANAGLPSPAPSTNKPSTQATANYTVPATHPRLLTIPKLHVQARVMAVGTTKSNAIGTPSNVYDTAWYTGSSLPGQSGVSLIDGHVSSWTTHGVFYDLKSLRSGDQMSIALGNGTVLHYMVTRVQTFDTQSIDASTMLAPATVNKPGLNLVTCAGNVVAGSNEFSKRVVVYTTQV